jgi:hypothetical protein
MAIQYHRLAALVTLLDEQIAALPDLGSPYAPGWLDRRAAHDRAVDRLCAMLERREAAEYSERGPDSIIVIANLRATATSGREGALRNWRRAARAKLDFERGEPAGAAGE